jgi:hypothetical protein
MADEHAPTQGRRMKSQVPILALALLLALAGLALTHSSVERPRAVLSGGASESATGDHAIALRATLGQPVVGVVSSHDGEIALGQGFWHEGALPEGGYHIHLPLVTGG